MSLKQNIIGKFKSVGLDNLPNNNSLYFHILQPLYSQWRKQPDHLADLNDPRQLDLRIDLLCKLYQEPAKPQIIDKFILSVPYFVKWAFPLAFLAQCKHIVKVYEDDNESTKRKSQWYKEQYVMAQTFLKQPVFRYFSSSADVTNHQEITFVEYLAWNTAQQAFYSKIAHNYKCCVNVQIFQAPFNDFLLQINANPFEVLDLGALCMSNAMAPMQISFKYISHETKLTKPVSFPRYQHTCYTTESFSPFKGHILRICIERSGRINTPYTSGIPNTLTHAIYDQLNRFWQEMLAPIKCDLKLKNFSFKICVFDIEAGYSQSLEPGFDIKDAPKTIPTFVNGFVQCICFFTSVLRGDYEFLVAHHYVYLPPNNKHFNMSKFEEKWREYTSKLPYWFRHAECSIFSNERDMIEQFLAQVYMKTDILIGYNSKQFDLPFLTMRYNFLKTPIKEIFKKPSLLTNYTLSYGYSNSLQSIRLTSMNVHCPQCKSAVNLNNVHVPDQIDCLKCLSYFALTPEVLATLKCELSSQWGSKDKGTDKNYSNGQDYTPFLYHHDLLNSQVIFFILYSLFFCFLTTFKKYFSLPKNAQIDV